MADAFARARDAAYRFIWRRLSRFHRLYMLALFGDSAAFDDAHYYWLYFVVDDIFLQCKKAC